MTGSDASRASVSAGTLTKRKLIAWPASLVVFLFAAVGGHNDLVEAGWGFQYWVVVTVLVVFYAVVAVIFLVTLARQLRRRWIIFKGKALAYDALHADLEKWKHSAAEATVRAEHAEKQMAVWTLENLNEGRRRILAEMRAFAHKPEFKKIEVGILDDKLMVGATWDGEVPLTNTRYVMQSTILGDLKAMLECIEVRQNRTAVFEVKSTVTDHYRTSLTKMAHGTSRTIADAEIVPRTPPLNEEHIWPEN